MAHLKTVANFAAAKRQRLRSMPDAPLSLPRMPEGAILPTMTERGLRRVVPHEA
jgi:hypothetical protein